MLINHDQKFVFIHVQKNAGISIEHTIKKHFPTTKVWHGRHGRASDGINEIGIEKWDQYYSFAFVRNPWDRMVSWYSMIQSAKKNLPFYKKWTKSPFESELWNYAINNSNDFESFLENCTDVIFDLGCYKSFAFNQMDYLTDEYGNIVVDYIGRFEDIDSEILTILHTIGIKDFVFPQKNKSQHQHYRTYYSAHAQRIVEERFSKDIQAFGYTF